MRIIVLLAVFSSFICPAFAATDREAVVEGINAFALDLYRQIGASERGNVFFSPAGIYSVLAMTYAGARGDTSSRMAGALHVSIPPERYHAALAEVRAGLEGPGPAAPQALSEMEMAYQRELQRRHLAPARASAGSGLTVANALWGQTGLPLRQEFLDLVERYYKGGFRQVDFDRPESGAVINRWVEEKTMGRIRDMVSPNVGSKTGLVLTNAVYFKDRWSNPFDPFFTVEKPFRTAGGRTVRTPMMGLGGKFRFFEDNKVQVLEMTYAGDRLAMVIILPRKGVALGAVEKSLTARVLGEWLARLSEEEVSIELPRFKTTRSLDLRDALIRLGMKDVFTEAADFSGMTEKVKLSLSAAVHKAFVEVNEEGTEAAAATAVETVATARQSDYKDIKTFIADHPFIFLIRDGQSGSIIFAGRLANPGDR
jgi:serpin B